ncbi:TetR/AcrR family transcriptional regulator [Amycolatopsis thermoflava]|uniref:TetR/AcrR family transcriptional regulator n=1 Tax=Amycolatopsis thermoflava TaxID=84480 RepID=UPI003EBB3436
MGSTEDLTTRARIRDAALARFGAEGVDRANLRAIAADAGVSPGLVIHHFGSKEGLRRACDEHVMAAIRGPDDDTAAWQDPANLAGLLEAAAPARRYLARAFVDNSAEVAALYDEIVEVTQAWLERGAREGWVRENTDPRTRAALYVTWLLAPLILEEHLTRVLGTSDLHDTDTTLRYAGTAVEMLTHGVFTDERAVRAWDTARQQRGAR